MNLAQNHNDIYIYIYISLLVKYSIEYLTRKFENASFAAKSSIPAAPETRIVFATLELILDHH